MVVCMDKKIEKWIKDNGCQEYCNYCIWSEDCLHVMFCYGGEPVELPCYRSEPEEFLDLEAIECELEKGDME